MGGTGLSPAPEVTVLMVLDVLSSPAPAPELSLERFCRCLLLGAQRGHRQGTEGTPRAPGHCHHSAGTQGHCPGARALSPGACALILAKLT